MRRGVWRVRRVIRRWIKHSHPPKQRWMKCWESSKVNLSLWEWSSVMMRNGTASVTAHLGRGGHHL